MPTFRDLTGQKFGRLLVQFRAPNKGVQTTWTCLCDCGNITLSTSGNLTFGKSTSCGCGRIKHGHTTKRNQSGTYQTWRNMIRRCIDANNKDYKNYGARGITVCERWIESFDSFLADMGERPKGLTLDRKDNDGHYCPENCEWATRLQQCHNRRNSKQ
jgi:hypothetical protein